MRVRVRVRRRRTGGRATPVGAEVDEGEEEEQQNRQQLRAAAAGGEPGAPRRTSAVARLLAGLGEPFADMKAAGWEVAS